MALLEHFYLNPFQKSYLFSGKFNFKNTPHLIAGTLAASKKNYYEI